MCQHHASAAPAERGSNRRRHLWELDPSVHCTIVGTCLTLADIRRLGHQLQRKGKLSLPGTLAEYELHGLFVNLAGSRLPAGKLLDRMLDTRHKRQVRAFAKADSPQMLRALWEAAVAHGEVPGGCWATLSHPMCDDDLQTAVLGEVHIMSHLSGAAQNAEARRMHAAEAEASALETRLAEAEAEGGEAKARVRALEDEVASLTAALEAEQRRRAALETDELRRRLAELELAVGARDRQLWAYEAQAAEAAVQATSQARQIEALEARLAAQSAETSALEATLAAHLAEHHADEVMGCEGCENHEACADELLRGKRVLYLGGHLSLAHHYRQVVEWQGGELVYHDGGFEHQATRLDDVLSRVHVVVCPVSAVSHDACLRAKQYCKRNALRFMPLRSPGVASLAQALQTLH